VRTEAGSVTGAAHVPHHELLVGIAKLELGLKVGVIEKAFAEAIAEEDDVFSFGGRRGGREEGGESEGAEDEGEDCFGACHERICVLEYSPADCLLTPIL